MKKIILNLIIIGLAGLAGFGQRAKPAPGDDNTNNHRPMTCPVRRRAVRRTGPDAVVRRRAGHRQSPRQKPTKAKRHWS